ncbi:MAG TPA: sugar transferase [Ktedonobacterales bacterium]
MARLRHSPRVATASDAPTARDGALATPLAGAAASTSGAEIVVRRGAVYEVVKRLFDIVFAAVALVLLAPVFLALALVVKLSDGGPVWYRREVVGWHGRRFYARKFRTMLPHADEYLAAHPELLARYAAQIKLREDPRTTRVGRVLRRTSLDELPQLWHVLRGEMSLVGPRMIHPSEVARYGAFALARQSVRPGITGLWQVSGRQAVSYARRVELDEEYMRRRSLWLDLRILLKTVVVVLSGRGAY